LFSINGFSNSCEQNKRFIEAFSYLPYVKEIVLDEECFIFEIKKSLHMKVAQALPFPLIRSFSNLLTPSRLRFVLRQFVRE
jgi:hypothetical protein